MNSIHSLLFKRWSRSLPQSCFWPSSQLRLPWSVKANLGYSLIYSTFKSQGGSSFEQNDLATYLHILPLKASLGYDLHLKDDQWIIPFVEAGSGYYLYFQRGEVQGMSINGGTFQPHITAGLKISLNNIFSSSSESYRGIPMYLTAQYHNIFGSGQDVNFGSETFLIGFNVAL